MRLCKVFSSLITSKMWIGGPHSAEGPGPLLCYSGFTSICLLLVQALLAFAVADEVLKAGLNAWDRFYLGLGLRGNLLGLGWAVCPLRTGQQDAGVQQWERGRISFWWKQHPSHHGPGMNPNFLAEDTEPCGHFLPSPTPENGSFLFAKFKAFKNVLNTKNSNSYYSLYSFIFLGETLCCYTAQSDPSAPASWVPEFHACTTAPCFLILNEGQAPCFMWHYLCHCVLISCDRYFDHFYFIDLSI
jgi:hypothetical protein